MTLTFNRTIRMPILIHRAKTRGHADHGWLSTYHTFSFADYFNPERMNFGVLRVLNDDTIAPESGFGMHRHENMEIVTVMLQGALQHKDSMGNTGLLTAGDVQVMSAGTGVRHSEENSDAREPVELLQLWIETARAGVAPRYDQKTFSSDVSNAWQELVVPGPVAGKLWIHQEAYISRARIASGADLAYTLRDARHGVYFFLIEGGVEFDNQELHRRDGLGVSGGGEWVLRARELSDVLAIEVPV